VPVVYEGRRAVFRGRCTIDEAEALRGFFVEHDDPLVDLGPCEQAHLALLQLVRIADAPIERMPADSALHRQLALIVKGSP